MMGAMFEHSQTWKRFSRDTRTLKVHLGHVPFIEPEEGGGRSGWKIAVAMSVLLHVAFFLVQLPASTARPLRIGTQKPVYVVKQIRFQPPPPQAQQEIPKRREKKRVIPVPDPTPEEPEPIRLAEVEVPELDFYSRSDAFGIPEGPPFPGYSGPAPLRMSGDIVPPEKLFYPAPRYTEEGRQQRVQGVVILEAIIDRAGNVNQVRVLKGLPMGLTESAVEAASSWKFRPATRNGEPVAVYFNLTIRFSLQ